jgi:hypothetical protein
MPTKATTVPANGDDELTAIGPVSNSARFVVAAAERDFRPNFGRFQVTRFQVWDV